ncbi:MAG: hypothetical protein C4K49_09945 [Candidatus Thorarchaeota archaeon]|nr:MAG: hypothetical protein C4K49_09945 [Candidatus Thorarchaeota archaeon]
MTQGVRNLAWSVISQFFNNAFKSADLVPGNLRTVAEAARIALLTRLVAVKLGIDASELLQASCPMFSRLSWAAEEEGVEHSQVMSLALSCLDSLDDDASRVYSLLSQVDMPDLLSLVHSMGCHLLPVAGQKNPLRKPLGVFYTPREVSDFIVEHTLGPTFDAIICRVRNEGIEALTPLLSLVVLDPACGPGAFLISAINALLQREQRVVDEAFARGDSSQEVRQYWRSTVLETFRKNLFGVDLDAASLEIADVSMSLLIHPTQVPVTRVGMGSVLKQGNSIISLKGLDGTSDFSHYFENPASKRSFEWRAEFPDVFEKHGGFDFVVMNPPYNRLKPNLTEFVREQFSSDSSKVDTCGYAEYISQLKEEARFYKESGEYPASSSHAIDTYRLFIERSLGLTREGGSVGFIVPSSILGDISAEHIRRLLLTEHSVLGVYEFLEGAKLFLDVTQSQSIVILTKGFGTIAFGTCFGLRSIQEAGRRRPLRMSVASIRQAMGNAMVIPRVDDKAWAILQQLHHNPTLGSLKWLECRRGELDLTLNRKHILLGMPGSRLVRGTHISRYSLQPPASEKSESVDIDRFSVELGTSERTKHLNRPRIACQQISNRAQRWRLKFAPIPPRAVLANSCNYISISGDVDQSLLLYLMGILNSYLLNWRFDLSNSNNHVSNRELATLPIVDPSSASQETARRLIDCVGQVLKGDMDSASIIESAVFALYGMGRDDVHYILSSRGASENERVSILKELSGHHRHGQS